MDIMHEYIPEQEYLSILEKVPVCCVDVVVCHDGKYLLIYRHGGSFTDTWWIPGGRVHKNERLKDAVVRKVFQETGLHAIVRKQIGSYEGFEADPRLPGGMVHCITTGFVVDIIGNADVTLDQTSIKYMWCDTIDDQWHPLLRNILEDSGVIR